MKNIEEQSCREHTPASSAGTDAPSGSPKWAALVGDRAYPMPRRRLSVEDILAQSGAKPGQQLVRDLDSPVDVAFSPRAPVDLAEGNVFRLVEECAHEEPGAKGAPPKLAIFLDDAWEVTVIPRQTEESLHGLFDLDAGTQLFRDLESPNDESIAPGQSVLYQDGPVFCTGERSIGLRVSNRILGASDPASRFRVIPTEPLLRVMQKGAHLASVHLLPDQENPLDRLHNLRGHEVGPAITNLDESIGAFVRRPGATSDFGIELVLAIRVNSQWRVATAASMNPRQILALFGLDPADYSLYRGTNVQPLPADTAIELHRGEGFEAQKDGKYGMNA